MFDVFVLLLLFELLDVFVLLSVLVLLLEEDDSFLEELVAF
jgi:hypothetical protein